MGNRNEEILFHLESRSWCIIPSYIYREYQRQRSNNIKYCLAFDLYDIFFSKTGETTFPVEKENDDSNIQPFPIPYDLPLIPYKSEDNPFVNDIFDE